MASQAWTMQDTLINAVKNDPVITSEWSEPILAFLEHGKTLEELITVVGRQNNVPKMVMNRLTLLRDLMGLTGGKWETVKVLIREKSVMNASDIAVRYYSPAIETNSARKEVEDFHYALFRAEPAAVMLGLLQKNKKSLVPQGVECASLIEILSAFVKAGHKMNKTPISRFYQTRLNRQRDETDDGKHELNKNLMEYLQQFQRLGAMAVTPFDILPMIRAGFASAQSIAAIPLDAFKTSMRAEGLPETRAQVIHESATLIDYRNEEAWIDLLRQKQNNLVLIERSTEQSSTSTQQEHTRKAPYNMTDMFHLQSMEVEEGYSITSMSAYFVDLLRLLQGVKCFEKPLTDGRTSAPLVSTAFDKLMKRRPDLKHIELSYENESTLVDYIDIANEAMESFVLYINAAGEEEIKLQKMKPFNISRPKADGKQANTQFSVYESYLARQMYPFNVLPYLHSLDSDRELLLARGSSRKNILKVFRSEDLVVASLLRQFERDESHSPLGLIRAVEDALDRAQAAEELNISQEDFLAITGEGYWPKDSFPTVFYDTQEEYIKRTYASFHAASLWGYSHPDVQKATEMMTSYDNGTGLTYIKTQFLPRSGLTFAELMSLVQTQYVGRRLAIVPMSGGDSFSGSIEDMRLWATPLNGAPGKLSAELCQELQSFVRLRQKLGWSIQALDRVVSCLRRNAVASGVSLVYKSGISPEMVVELASVKRVSELLKESTDEILPLWADIDTYGSNSLYGQLFLQIEPLPEKYKLHDGGYLTNAGQIRENEGHILAAYDLNKEELTALLSAANLTLTDTFDLESASSIYRHALLCRLLSIPYEDCSILVNLHKYHVDVFANPSVTLGVLEEYQSLVRHGWNLHKIASVCGLDVKADSDRDSANYNLDNLTKDVCELIRIACTTQAVPRSDNGKSGSVIAGDIVQLASQVFDLETGNTIAQIVEGSPLSSITIDLTQDDTAVLIESLPPWLSLMVLNEDGKLQQCKVFLYCYLSLEEQKRIGALLSDNPEWLSGVEKLVRQSQTLMGTINDKLSTGSSDVKGSIVNAFTELFKTWDTDKWDKEGILLERGKQFVELAEMELRAVQIRSGFQKQLRDTFPNTNATILNRVFADALTTNHTKAGEKGSPTTLPIKRLLLQKMLHGTSSKSYLHVPTADTYIFSLPCDQFKNPDGKQPRLEINGLLIPSFNPEAGRFTFKPVVLQNGQATSISANFKLQDLEWMASTGPRASIPEDRLTDHVIVDHVRSICQRAIRILAAIEGFKLDQEEIEFIAASDGVLNVDIGKLDLRQFKELHVFKELRDGMSHTKGLLLRLLAWINKPDNPETLQRQISVALDWPESFTRFLIKTKYDGLSADQILSKLRDIGELQRLYQIRTTLKDLGVKQDEKTISAVFGLAIPDRPFQTGEGFTRASTFRSLLLPTISKKQAAKYHQHLQINQRNALTEYLLQQKAVRDLGINDADGLFEHLLVDVQMGYQLQTSRMKQAVSTVQLYVQRCLYGLEADNGILPEHVQRDQWEWMQKFVLWEAARKLMLYPENWIDPVLRTQKTSFFESFETAIMSNDLNLGTFAKAMTAYINSLHEVADLDVQAYLRYISPGRTADSFHFFAATRTAPYNHFYRRLDIIDSNPYWTPWSKMDLDIITHEADWDGSALPKHGSYMIPVLRGGRLYLYTPQIVLKTLPNEGASKTSIGKTPSNKASFKTLADQPVGIAQPIKKWEIKLAWTEYVDGQWLPKRISQATLKVDSKTVGDKENQLPPVSNFHFFFDTKDNEHNDFISLAVGCRYKDDSYSSLGHFVINGDFVTLDETGKGYSKSPLPTVFNKVSYKFSEAKKILESADDIQEFRYGSSDLKPILAIPEVVKKNEGDITWTLAYEENETEKNHKLAGLLTDIEQSDEPTKTLFYYRPKGFHSGTITKDLAILVQKVVFNFPLSPYLKRAITTKDSINGLFKVLSNVPALTKPQTELEKKTKALNETEQALATSKVKEELEVILLDQKQNIFGLSLSNYHELSKPYASYAWEIGVHSVMLAMERLLATQQYDTALQIAHLVFDPTIDGVSSEKCWRFPPFQDIARSKPESVDNILNGLRETTTRLGSGPTVGLGEKRPSPSIAHMAAQKRPIAYMKRIMMKYIEILIAAGDVYFRQGTLEAIPAAIQRYIEAMHILGPDPPELPNISRRTIQTFDSLKKDIWDMELDFPFSCELGPRVTGEENTPRPGFLCTLRTSYFAIPSNPQFQSLRTDLKARLYNIRNCLDINGKPITYSLLEPSIDPAILAKLGGRVANAAMLASDTSGPMPNYRFSYLISRALDMCGELKGFGEMFLSATEKKDTEALAVLRARQDTALQNMYIDLKRLQAEEAQKTLESLERTRESHVSRLGHYLALIGESPEKIPTPDKEWQDLEQTLEPVSNDELRMTISERVEMACAEEASRYNMKATALELEASVLMLLPNLMENVEPMGMGVSLKVDAGNVAQCLGLVASVQKMMAQAAGDRGSRAMRKTQMMRQLQDRRLQANMAGHDLKNIDKQIETQMKRLAQTEKDIEISKTQAQNAAEVESWYRSKFTNEQLYTWMENSARSLYYEAYVMTMELATRAEKGFQFERADPSQTFIKPEGYWDSSRGGLFASQNIYLAIKKMELAYQDRRWHDFELTKNVSLRSIDPLALIKLRETGTAQFSLPELLFDMDCPGHYMRRIKSVSLSLPCIVGPYTSVSATLSLTSHKYRIDASARTVDEYNKKGSDRTSFRTDRIPQTSVALSSGQQDSGTFELDFQGERFMPFEGAGVISDWHIELPTEAPQFDYHTISDVIVSIRYTSLDGGLPFKQAVNASVAAFTKGAKADAESQGLYALFDLRNDFSSAWSAFEYELKNGAHSAKLQLADLSRCLPFWARGSQVTATNISIVLRSTQSWSNQISLLHAGGKITDWNKEPLSDSSQILSAKSNPNANLDTWTLELKREGAMSFDVKNAMVLVRYKVKR